MGIRDGWAAIDCGCGPAGGLAVMVEMTGTAGLLAGFDFREPAIKRALSAPGPDYANGQTAWIVRH